MIKLIQQQGMRWPKPLLAIVILLVLSLTVIDTRPTSVWADASSTSHAPPIRVASFTNPRVPQGPLLPVEGDSGASTLVNALQEPANFGPEGVVRCPVELLLPVTSVAPRSLVDEQGNRLAEVFFAGPTIQTLTQEETDELVAFLNAGGVVLVSGNGDLNKGPTYNPLFAALKIEDRFETTIPTGLPSGQSSELEATPITDGPFGRVGPLFHSTGNRGISTVALQKVAVAQGRTDEKALIAEGEFGLGYLVAVGDPLYLDLFITGDFGDPEGDNLTYFMNLVAQGCPKEKPTAIDLASFEVEANDGRAMILWETATEIDNAGFNIYRAPAPDGPWVQVNQKLIAAEGDPVAGAGYNFVDTPGRGVFYYQLEDIDYYGVSTLHDAVKAEMGPTIRLPWYRPIIPAFK